MRAIILVDIDGTYDQTEEVLDQLEEMAAEGAALKVGRACFVEVITVQEAAILDEKNITRPWIVSRITKDGKGVTP